MSMHVRDLATSVGVHWKCPDAAAPQSTPKRYNVMSQELVVLLQVQRHAAEHQVLSMLRLCCWGKLSAKVAIVMHYSAQKIAVLISTVWHTPDEGNPGHRLGEL